MENDVYEQYQRKVAAWKEEVKKNPEKREEIMKMMEEAEKELEKNKVTIYESYIEIFEEIEGEVYLKTEGENLKKALKILDIIRDGKIVKVREALEILEDARAILLEYTELN